MLQQVTPMREGHAPRVRGRRGRKPRAQEPARKFVGFWVTDDEHRKLRQLAKQNHHGNVGPLCRDIVVGEAEDAAES
jgi:hypothetical protein